MPSLLRDNPFSHFSRGFFYPFGSFRLFLKFPSLLKYVAIPFVINLLIFSLAVFFGLDFFNDVVVHSLPQGEAWYWAVLYYLLWLLAVLLTAVLVFFSFTVVGNLVASPFNDLLSERVEERLTGALGDEPFSWPSFAKDARRALVTEVKKISLFVGAMLLILPLNLIPAVGSALYSVLAVLLTLFFLVVEYLSFVLMRKRLSFSDQRRYILSRKFLMLGFGTGVLALLALPLLQFLCIPAAVAGATRLWCDQRPSPPVTGEEAKL